MFLTTNLQLKRLKVVAQCRGKRTAAEYVGSGPTFYLSTDIGITEAAALY